MSKGRITKQLARDIALFLANGGTVNNNKEFQQKKADVLVELVWIQENVKTCIKQIRKDLKQHK